MSLIDYLKTKASDFEDLDFEWRKFIQDHRRIILSKSTLQTLTVYESDKYKYRPEEYLESIGVNPGLAWIVLWINQIPNNEYFVDIEQLHIPDEKYINSLRQSYRSVRKELRASEIIKN